MSVTAIDPDLMHHARIGLYAGADALDALADRAPYDADYGEAATVVAVLLATQLEVGALLASEAGWLAAAVGECQQQMTATDAAQVLDRYRIDG